MGKLASLFFGANALTWIVYATTCIFYPDLLADLGVYDQAHWVEIVEVRAMYGGAQLAIGLYALLALLKPSQHQASALAFFILLFTGLASVRLVGLLIDGPGLGMTFGDVGPASYNAGALWFFEVPMLIMGIVLALKTQSNKGPVVLT